MLSALLLASCSTASDPATQLGLTPEALSSDTATLTAETEAAMPSPEMLPSPDNDETTAARTTGQLEDTGTATKAAADAAGGNLETAANANSVESGASEPAKRGLFASLFAAKPAAPADTGSKSAAAQDEKIENADDASGVAEPPKAEADNMPVAEQAVAESSEVPEAGVTEEDRQHATDETDAKKRSFLSAFFSAKQPPAVQAAETAAITDSDRENAKVEGTDDEKNDKVVLSAALTQTKPVNAALISGEALPGVRDSDGLFEISRKVGSGDGDLDLYEMDANGYQVASAAGMARLAPNGLLKQRDSVDTACLTPSLVRMLKTLERHYGKRIIVTSGYRSPSYNRKVRGARNSMHMYCKAADIQIPGVSKWEIARYARSLPGRGGVGTYCHTKSVHVDVGPERDWNWRCRRSN